MQLKPGTLLQGGKYKIEKVLGQGGFGITYLAEHAMLGGNVAIKEFFFKDYCDRDETTSHVTIGTKGNREIVNRFKLKFIKEAKTIFKLSHPNIVRILDIFEENGTAYYVMDYIEGESLGDIVKHRGAIPEKEAIEYIREVGSALSYIHSRNMNHLDIKPANIMRRRSDGHIFVIDFGVSKQYDANTSEGTTTTPVGISHGYSPLEQYQRNGVQTFSPPSDVYALAATLYKLLTGITPPEAMIVHDEGLPLEPLRKKHTNASTIDAIVGAMKPRKQRIQSISAFITELCEQSNDFIKETTGTQEVYTSYNEKETTKGSTIIDTSTFNVEPVKSAKTINVPSLGAVCFNMSELSRFWLVIILIFCNFGLLVSHGANLDPHIVNYSVINYDTQYGIMQFLCYMTLVATSIYAQREKIKNESPKEKIKIFLSLAVVFAIIGTISVLISALISSVVEMIFGLKSSFSVAVVVIRTLLYSIIASSILIIPEIAEIKKEKS